MKFPRPEEVQQLRDKLPDKLGEAIFSTGTADAIRAISEKLDFDSRQRAALADEIGLVLLTYTTPDEFPARVKERTGIRDEQLETVQTDAQRQIFDPVMPLLTGEGDTATDTASETDAGEKTVAQVSDKEAATLLRESAKEEGYLLDQIIAAKNN